jgi:integral membrane protein
MKTLFTTKLGRLRLIGFLEGISLLILAGIGVPLKYAWGDPSLVKMMGPVHGLLFLLFIINTISVGVTYRWQFSNTTWKVLLACIIPFGTFYIDRKILSKMNYGNTSNDTTL